MTANEEPSQHFQARRNTFLQLFVATAMGDSLGLAYENMS